MLIAIGMEMKTAASFTDVKIDDTSIDVIFDTRNIDAMRLIRIDIAFGKSPSHTHRLHKIAVAWEPATRVAHRASGDDGAADRSIQPFGSRRFLAGLGGRW